MHGLLFKTPDYAFLDYKLFEDLPLPDFEDNPDGYDLAGRLVTAAPNLAKLPPDETLFRWLLRRINYLSDGRLTLDSEYGDEGYYPLSILVTRGPTPVAVLEFEGSDYDILCFARSADRVKCDAAVEVLIATCSTNPNLTRQLSMLDED